MDNDNAWLEQLKSCLQGLGETEIDEALSVQACSDRIDLALRDGDPARYDLALVDLEMGAATEQGPTDLFGRDKVLRSLRRKMPWVPVALVSRFVLSHPLARSWVSTYAFDAILGKDYFQSKELNTAEWRSLRDSVLRARKAALLALDPFEYREREEETLEVDAGVEVDAQLAKVGLALSEVGPLLRTAGLRGNRVVLDSVVPGYSGSCVLRATAELDNRTATWLVKCGRVDKLFAEASSHRRVAADGLTRRLMTPLVHPGVLLGRGAACIVYEFEAEAVTLRSAYRSDKACLGALVTTATASLYQGARRKRCLLRPELERLWTPKTLATVGDELRTVDWLSALAERKPHPRLDHSVILLVGVRHGDMHGGNIMLGAAAATLIDFAHYQCHGERSIIPMMDLAQLLVDLWVHGRPTWPVQELLEGDLPDDVRALVGVCLGSSPVPEELEAFRFLVVNWMIRYTSFADVEEAQRRELTDAVKRYLSAGSAIVK